MVIIHIKGFASGIDWTEDLLEACVKMVEKHAPTTLVWDGDLFAQDSFTRVIWRFAEANANVEFVAYMRALESMEHEQTLLNSFPLHSKHLRIERIEVEDYVELGVEAMRRTGAKLCLVFGVGPTVQREISCLHEIHIELLPLLRREKL